MSDKIILFDCFGVIATEVANAWFARYFSPEEAKVRKDAIFTLADCGKMSEADSYLAMERISGEPAEQIKKDWHDMTAVNEEVIAYIRELKKTHKVYLLSNAIASFLTDIMERFGFKDAFDGVYISSDMRLIKPSPEYFQYVIDELGITPSDAVMIDDNAKNIEGAKATGLNGIVFTGLENLKKDIEPYL